MNKLQKYVHNPLLLYSLATSRGLTCWVPDELHLKMMHRAHVGRWPNLDKPRTFNEKLQWLKLNDHNPLYNTLVDKYTVKQWVANRIGSEYVTKTYARWDSTRDVDISSLPERFVLKTNHDCGGIAICRDRATFDLEAALSKLSKHLSTNYYWGSREWPYKDVKPCVFAEEYLEPDASGDLPDYKLFCFSNSKIITLLITDRFTKAGVTQTFFDEEWHLMELTEGGHPTRPNSPKPKFFDEMKRLASILSSDLPFVRVDFYESEGRLLFGEMTLYPKSGFECFDPEEWNIRLGSWINFPEREGASL